MTTTPTKKNAMRTGLHSGMASGTPNNPKTTTGVRKGASPSVRKGKK